MVTMCLDRAGIVGDDGFTHHGVFDYAYLRSMPRMTIMAPKDENELRQMPEHGITIQRTNRDPLSARQRYWRCL